MGVLARSAGPTAASSQQQAFASHEPCFTARLKLKMAAGHFERAGWRPFGLSRSPANLRSACVCLGPPPVLRRDLEVRRQSARPCAALHAAGAQQGREEGAERGRLEFLLCRSAPVWAQSLPSEPSFCAGVPAMAAAVSALSCAPSSKRTAALMGGGGLGCTASQEPPVVAGLHLLLPPLAGPAPRWASMAGRPVCSASHPPFPTSCPTHPTRLTTHPTRTRLGPPLRPLQRSPVPGPRGTGRVRRGRRKPHAGAGGRVAGRRRRRRHPDVHGGVDCGVVAAGRRCPGLPRPPGGWGRLPTPPSRQPPQPLPDPTPPLPPRPTPPPPRPVP